MPYSSKADVLFYGQFSTGDFGASGYDEEASYQKAIADADRMIDNYCNAPEQFFTPGGIEIQNEYLNGTDVAYLGGITKFFAWYYGGTSHLKFKYSPVLSVTKLEEETGAGTWTTRTEGTGSDFIVVSDGVRYVMNTPAWKYKNVRATYKAGYVATPWQVQQVSGRLAAAILQRIEDAKSRVQASVGGLSVTTPPPVNLTTAILTDDLKQLLQNFRCAVYAFV